MPTGTPKTILIAGNKSISIIEEDSGIKIIINGVEEKFIKEGPLDKEGKIKFAHQKKREYYSGFLQSHFENLIILSGAGTSVEWGGKTMKEIWDLVKDKLTPDGLSAFCSKVGFDENKGDLEGLLSRANIAKEFVSEGTDVSDLIKKCEEVILKNCKITLNDSASHHAFLNKITNRKLKDPRAKIFTLNYDTLFEQAAVKGGFTCIDGFSFASPRTLSGRNFDFDLVYRERSRIKEEESFVPKVFHLYKPHGSINWELDNDQIIINGETTKPLMIYPKDSKYENSYEQPFFEMMSRFQQNLRNDNVLLITIGFSFNDKHIVTAIKEAVRQNPSFRLLIITRTLKEDGEMKWFMDMAKQQFNVTMVEEKFKEFVEFYPYSKIYSEKQEDGI